jgi:RNA polymerase sigma-70 factor (ECF subfamily)
MGSERRMSLRREIVARARAGDLVALESLISDHQQAIGRFVIAETGANEDYLDLCQTVFVKMMKGLPRLRSEDVFEPWLYQIARNVCRDYLRKERHRRRLFVPMTGDHDHASPPVESLDPPGDKSLGEAIAKLDKEQRRVIELSAEQPRSYRELARLTKSSLAAVRNRLARARQRLRQLLTGLEDRHGH